jgi:hypothetical protein
MCFNTRRASTRDYTVVVTPKVTKKNSCRDNYSWKYGTRYEDKEKKEAAQHQLVVHVPWT